MECGEKLLFLHRHNEKSQGGKWGVRKSSFSPHSKIEIGENECDAMIREAREETGIELVRDKLEYLDKVFVRYPDYDFVYHMFRARLSAEPIVVINPKEHQTFLWTISTDALKMNLVLDLDTCIKMYY